MVEKLERQVKYLKLKNQIEIKDNVKLKLENEYLTKCNKVLETVEQYLPHRINVLKEAKTDKYDIAILELQKLADALNVERKKMEICDEAEED